ncbi:MAG: hypothetical protein L6R41_005753 [Letrouitia leprolyta]|nr:MAG: hypothetical protein L6R41_005753 [Letrouitia leprolyta]
MASSLKPSAVTDICHAIDKVTADKNRIPGCVFVAVNKDGKALIEHASGDRGLDTQEPITLDSVFWIASCTKMICGIAAMQLVEQGLLALDDADQLEDICPELRTISILKNVDKCGNPEMIDKKHRITLRMLLTHTAGFGYAYSNDKIRRWGQPIGHDDISGHPDVTFRSPLLFEPGTDWEYGVGIDWAGRVIERVSGLSLCDYMQKNICEPLRLEKLCFLPTVEMQKDLVYMHHREPNGKLRERDHPYQRPWFVNGDDTSDIHHAGGHGCFARPTEYCDILSALLNSGTSPKTSARILSPASIEEMFTNQIPDLPDFGRRGMTIVKPDLANPIPDFYPQPLEQPQGWGITFMMTIHETWTGRGRNTAFWAGLPNVFWWCDREKGVAGMIAVQILPFADEEVMCLLAELESMVYANLEEDVDEVPARTGHLTL